MSLLVPIDLSAPSRIAIELAVWLGKELSEEIVLLHVSPAPPPLETLAGLYKIAEPLRQAGLTAKLRTVAGLPVEQIPKEASRRKARWVVMGTRGLLDESSTAAGVARATSIPVLAVRPGKNSLLVDDLQLLAGPRSKAPVAWELSSILASAAHTEVKHLPEGTTNHCGQGCNALRVIDVPAASLLEFQKSSISCLRCSLVLVLHQ